jgi:NAD(P)-dependent dehydrogenase (short-subunit alcohol dehydrogenase family)
MPGQLRGRRALVTGSTSGIGRAIAERLAAEGATVVISGRNEAEGLDVVAGIESGDGLATYVKADLAEGESAINALAQSAAAQAGGPIDLLVNNAATLVPAQSMLEATQNMIDNAFAVNVRAPFLLTAAIVPPMIDAGGGSVINVGSVNGVTGMAVAALYGATKAALHSLTTSWAAEFASQGVRVNTIAPGPTRSASNAPYHEFLEQLAAGHPQGRAGTAEEVASAVVFLASDNATHIHGITLPVDGGFLAAR